MKRLAFTAVLLLLSADAFAAVRRTQWVENSGFESYAYYYRGMASTDFNHDGKADLALLVSYGVDVAFGRGDGTFDDVQNLTPYNPDDREYRSMNVADFTGDGFDDILVTDYGIGGLMLIVNRGDGTFAPPAMMSTKPLLPSASAVADFDGDGKLDVAVSSWEGNEVVVYAGDGSGGFKEKGRSAIAGDQTETIAAGDIDNDGHVDLAMARYGPSATVELYFGRGDGTFEDAQLVSVRSAPGYAVVLADLNGDHLCEVIAGNWDDNTVTVNVNLGSRTFSTAQAYSVVKPPRSAASPSRLAVADYNGDGIRDVAVACPNGWFVAVLAGNGDGTLSTPDFARISGGFSNSLPLLIAPADFDGDGRLDLAVYDEGGDSISVAINRTGDATLGVRPPALVSVDKDSTITVQVSAVVYGAPSPAGTVRLRSGGVIVDEKPVDSDVAYVTFHPTSLADQTLVAEYSGDDNYDPRTKEFVQYVTSETTTTAVTLARTTVGYGEQVTATVTVTSSKGDQPGGAVTLRRGTTPVASNTLYLGRTSASFGYSPVGTWTLTAEYSGDTSHPPSSGSCTFTVTKGTPNIQWPWSQAYLVAVGQQLTLRVYVGGGTGLAPTGTVTFYDGDVILGVAPVDQSACITFSPAAGSHNVRAAYSGDDRFLPGNAYAIVKAVFPGVFMLDARATAGTMTITWTPFAGASYYRIASKLVQASEYTIGQPYSSTTTTEPSSIVPTAPTLYRVEALDSNFKVLATTNTELAYGAPFADDPLFPGTVIRAVQLTDTLKAINAVRTAAGAPAVAIPGIATGSLISASDIQQLRNAAIDVRARLGIPAAVFTNDPAPAGPIRAVDIQDIREAVR